MAVEFLHNSDPSKACDQAADWLYTQIARIQREADATGPMDADPQPLIVGLCGGRSIVTLSQALLRKTKTLSPAQWSRLHFFMADERLVPLDSVDSNYRLLEAELFNPLLEQGLISQSQLHPFVVQPDEVDSGVADYATQLQAFGGRFDLVILGMGEDGHVAALFPGHEMLTKPSLGFVYFSDSPKPPAGRMSASMPLLTQAKTGALLCLGEGKRDAFDRFRSLSVSVTQCPAKMLYHFNDAIVVTDLLS